MKINTTDFSRHPTKGGKAKQLRKSPIIAVHLDYKNLMSFVICVFFFVEATFGQSFLKEDDSFKNSLFGKEPLTEVLLEDVLKNKSVFDKAVFVRMKPFACDYFKARLQDSNSVKLFFERILTETKHEIKEVWVIYDHCKELKYLSVNFPAACEREIKDYVAKLFPGQESITWYYSGCKKENPVLKKYKIKGRSVLIVLK